jgi:hypothetical protein
MAKIEKTVFISYRRKGGTPWALLVYKYLSENGFDVFFDFEGMSSGDFEQNIVGNIKARAHFLVILTPSALDRCNQPGDWLRREIETAIEEKRNIIPLFFDGFKFEDPSVSTKLTAELGKIKKYHGLNVYADYFDEAMEKLMTEKYLNKPLEAVVHPVSDEIQILVEKHKIAANKEIAQIINQGETKFSGFDVSTFKRIAQDAPKSTTGKLVDLSNLQTPTCAYCHKLFSTPWQQRAICDSCGSQYHINCGSNLWNAQLTHICVNCGQPIDSSKFKTF